MKKNARILWICLICLIKASLMASALPSTADKLTLSVNNKSLRSVLTEIEHQANVVFSYNSRIIDAKQPVSVTVTDERLEFVLQKILPAHISYQISGANVFLLPDASYVPESAAEKKKNVRKKVMAVKLMNAHDTVWIFKTDTLICLKLDTIHVPIQPDTLAKPIKKDSVIAPTLKKVKICFEPFYQSLSTTTNYDHFGPSVNDQFFKNVLTTTTIDRHRIGLYVHYAKERFNLTSGISILSSNEIFDYPDVIDSLKRTYQRVDTTYRWVTDTIKSLNKGTADYTYLSVPLFVGYKIVGLGKFQCNFAAGAWVNFLINHKGSCINMNDLSNYPSRFHITDVQKVPANKITVDLAFQIRFQYEVFKKTHLCVSPSYHLQLGSDYSLVYRITRRHSSKGLSLSLMKEF